MVQSTQAFESIIVEDKGDGVALVTLNRPKALNALCKSLCSELLVAMKTLNADENTRAIVLTGAGRAFAAGADLKEMKDKNYPDTYKDDFLSEFDNMARLCRKPLIGAINGFCLGGGNELAMMCDILLAGENAKFGQPEIKVGILPGMGGTQRLIRAIGKSRAMELVLTGEQMDAQEAAARGLVSRITASDTLVDEAVKMAKSIAANSTPAVLAAKECVNMAYEMNLEAGLLFERRMFHSSFATKDQKEGMGAFCEKRKPTWTHQ